MAERKSYDCFCNERVFYYVNKEKRTVTAMIKNCRLDLSTLLWKYGCSNNSDTYHMKDSLLAQAYCDPNDEWNEEIGKRVARRKLFFKYREHRNNLLKRYLSRQMHLLKDIEQKYINKKSKKSEAKYASKTIL